MNGGGGALLTPLEFGLLQLCSLLWDSGCFLPHESSDLGIFLVQSPLVFGGVSSALPGGGADSTLLKVGVGKGFAMVAGSTGIILLPDNTDENLSFCILLLIMGDTPEL